MPNADCSLVYSGSGHIPVMLIDEATVESRCETRDRFDRVRTVALLSGSARLADTVLSTPSL